MLIPTPALEQQVTQAMLDFLHDLDSGTGFSKDNLSSEPEARAQRVALAFGKAIGQAVDTWLMSVQLIIPPGGTVTAGGPTTQVSIDPATVSIKL